MIDEFDSLTAPPPPPPLTVYPSSPISLSLLSLLVYLLGRLSVTNDKTIYLRVYTANGPAAEYQAGLFIGT